jgi:hypothetical protein
VGLDDALQPLSGRRQDADEAQSQGSVPSPSYFGSKSERLDFVWIMKIEMNVSARHERRMPPVEHSLAEGEIVGSRAGSTEIQNASFRDHFTLAGKQRDAEIHPASGQPSALNRH